MDILKGTVNNVEQEGEKLAASATGNLEQAGEKLVAAATADLKGLVATLAEYKITFTIELQKK